MAEKYISLKEATKYCSYSADYLKLRARQGKLKAIKMARNWFTTKEWVEEYTNKQKNRVRTSGKSINFARLDIRKSQLPSKGHKEFLISRSELGRYFLFIIGLIIVFIILGAIINFKPVESILEKIIPNRIIEIER